LIALQFKQFGQLTLPQLQLDSVQLPLLQLPSVVDASYPFAWVLSISEITLTAPPRVVLVLAFTQFKPSWFVPFPISALILLIEIGCPNAGVVIFDP
jgi:hypothetical protein